MDCRLSNSNEKESSRTVENYKLDLGLLMLRIQKVVILTRPFLRLISYLKSLRGWENANHCLLILAFFNLSCFLIPAVYNLVFTLGFIIFCGSMGYMHRRSQCLMKVFPNPNVKQEDIVGEDGQITHNDVVKQYKTMLFTLDTIVQRYMTYVNHFYSVLKWDNLEESIRCYLEIALILIFLHLLPLRWGITMVINLFLLEHKAATLLNDSRLVMKLGKKQESVDRSDCISVDSTPSTENDTPTFSPPDFSDSDDSDAEKGDTSGPDDESDMDEEPNVAKTSTSKGGVVGKILEFKKKHQSATGNCVGCNVQFSTILKRRHICSHCGNHFCSRCCSHKVPRSMFGATSPAAQTETVPVCSFCNMYLTGKKDPAMLEKSAEREKETREHERQSLKEKEPEKEKEKVS